MKMLFQIDGIRCTGCVAKLEKMPSLDGRISSAQVYLPQNLLEVETKETSGTLAPSDISDIVAKLGFSANYLKNQIQIFEDNKISNRKRISQIGIAAFCAGNIMLFSAGIYVGADGSFRPLFAYMSCLLFLPLFIFSTLDIHKSALASLRLKVLNIDLPISVAMTAGFVFSTYNLINGSYDFIYYDSIASFIFLILSSRFVLEKLKQNYISYDGLFSKNLSEKYLVENISQKKLVHYTNIQPQDNLHLSAGQILPVDAIFVGNTNATPICEIDKKHITGEALPIVIHSGIPAPAGTHVLTNGSIFKATANYQNSTISKLDNILRDAQKSKGRFVTLSDTAAHYLILVVFLTAGIFFAYYSQISTFEAFQRSLALLIVACPCALALGTPLTYLFGIRRSMHNGILIKTNEVFDKIIHSKNIFIDKTGTLTAGRLKIKEASVNLDDQTKNLILNLESESTHPIAIAVRKEWAALYEELPLKDKKEIPGSGITASLDGQNIEFIKNSENNSSLSALLKIDGVSLVNISFEDELLEKSPNSIAHLKTIFKNIFLLSGDTQKETQRVASLCSISTDHIIFDALPEKKLSLIKKYAPAVMIGDGANDALALQGAHVGIAVSGSVDLSLKHSEVYFLKPGIEQLESLITISQKVRSTLILNLAISFAYNILAGFSALTGSMNPLIAAILMPLSSLIIILNTKRGLS